VSTLESDLQEKSPKKSTPVRARSIPGLRISPEQADNRRFAALLVSVYVLFRGRSQTLPTRPHCKEFQNPRSQPPTLCQLFLHLMPPR
jgi:hypothetical protein